MWKDNLSEMIGLAVGIIIVAMILILVSARTNALMEIAEALKTIAAAMK